MGFFSTWLQKLHETFIETQYWKLMLEGFGNTIVITLGALLIGVLIGTLIAVIKYCAEGTKALKPLAWICDLYVTVIRGVPVVVLLLIFYFIIMTSAEGITVGILTFGINSGAYMAELIRGGINSVDRGQMEAGRSLGMSKLQAMRKIIFPQALRYILPAIGNELIALLKETAVAGYGRRRRPDPRGQPRPEQYLRRGQPAAHRRGDVSDPRRGADKAAVGL